MIPASLRAALSRRDFLRGSIAAGGFAAGLAADVLSDPWLEGPREAWREVVRGAEADTIDPTSMDQTAVRLPYMAGNAIADARDIAAETGGLNRAWWDRAERAGVLRHATRVKRRDDGKLVIASHGDGLVLWGKDAAEKMPGTPLDEQPDRKFGRFADRCMWEAMQRRTPALHARRAETITKGHDRPRIIEYYAWTASDGVDTVSVALTLEQVARGRSPERSPPDTEGEPPHLLSHDATTPSPTSRLAGRRPQSVDL